MPIPPNRIASKDSRVGEKARLGRSTSRLKLHGRAQARIAWSADRFRKNGSDILGHSSCSQIWSFRSTASFVHLSPWKSLKACLRWAETGERQCALMCSNVLQRASLCPSPSMTSWDSKIHSLYWRLTPLVHVTLKSRQENGRGLCSICSERWRGGQKSCNSSHNGFSERHNGGLCNNKAVRSDQTPAQRRPGRLPYRCCDGQLGFLTFRVRSIWLTQQPNMLFRQPRNQFSSHQIWQWQAFQHSEPGREVRSHQIYDRFLLSRHSLLRHFKARCRCSTDQAHGA